MNQQLDPKYRPYLSRSQMLTILNALEGNESSEANAIRATFNLLLIKADAGIATGSYQPKKRKGVMDNLGFSVDSEEEQRYLNGEMTAEEEAAYQNKLMNPSI